MPPEDIRLIIMLHYNRFARKMKQILCDFSCKSVHGLSLLEMKVEMRYSYCHTDPCCMEENMREIDVSRVEEAVRGLFLSACCEIGEDVL